MKPSCGGLATRAPLMSYTSIADPPALKKGLPSPGPMNDPAMDPRAVDDGVSAISTAVDMALTPSSTALGSIAGSFIGPGLGNPFFSAGGSAIEVYDINGALVARPPQLGFITGSTSWPKAYVVDGL